VVLASVASADPLQPGAAGADLSSAEPLARLEEREPVKGAVLGWRDATGGVLVLVDVRHIGPGEGSRVRRRRPGPHGQAAGAPGRPCDRGRKRLLALSRTINHQSHVLVLRARFPPRPCLLPSTPLGSVVLFSDPEQVGDGKPRQLQVSCRRQLVRPT
jgi:hypothetical protein